MAPPRAAQDDDLDDLDDLLDEFNPAPASSTSSAPPAASQPAPTASKATTPAPASAADATDDFPDPDDDDLSALDADLVKDLEQGMASLFSGLEGGEGDEAEFKRIMEQLMKGEMGMPPAGSDAAPGASDEEGMAELLAALQMGAKGKGKAGASTAPAGGAGTSAGPAPPTAGGAPGNFQDTIAAAMAKMKDSGAKVDQEAEAKAAAGGDPLAAMMAQMAGMGGDFGGEEGLQGMLDEMMSQLISRDVLYEPLKELRDKYPAYLETNAATLSEKDLKRYKEQQATVIQIVAKFDEPGADAEGPFSPEEEAKHAERHADIMNDAGSPPKEIMGEMPPGMDLGPDGVPKVPEDCCIS
ncbi:Pex19 protein family-domain-containing protein [Leucosporidium creatinivorum]|uniref:Pex19 protein family-domain-containing protein n=1 Tax=Leucosporidium creatinivorum TaxID=106004 RepID=A0A1Y2FZD9_9BASI|nr:Pex19 protein family-domain-containing protein [Leucosporidium creatinivorum]